MIPLNYKVLIKDEVIEETTPGGIVLPGEQTGRRQAGSVFGRVVSMGPKAFQPKEVTFDRNNPAPKPVQDDFGGLAPAIGSRVAYIRNSGARYVCKDGDYRPIDEDYNDGGECYRMLNDIDITAIMESAND